MFAVYFSAFAFAFAVCALLFTIYKAMKISDDKLAKV